MMPMKNTIKYTLLFLTLLFSSSAIADNHSLMIHDAWVKEGPPSLKVLAGYLTIENKGDKDVIITEISSPSFKSVMVHKSEVKEAFATMVHVKELIIHPKTTVTFKPGSYHLMLKGPEKRVLAGDNVELNISLKSGKKVTITADVRKKAGSKSHEHHGDHMHKGH